MPAAKKTAAINMRVEPRFKALAEKAAEAERRSLTSYVEKLIADDLRKRRLLK